MSRLAVFASIALISLQSISLADSYNIQENQNLFGRLNQSDVGPNGVGGANNYCAPTATMNSFQYLQTVFGTPGNGTPDLMGASNTWLGAAQDLANNYMMTNKDTGTTDNNWINGKMNYLNTYAPGRVLLEGQDAYTTGGTNWVQQTTPTAGFILGMLQKGEDIELGISPTAGGGIGHVLTLTGIVWNDQNNNLVFDPSATNTSETMSLDGIDPGDPNNSFDYNMKLITFQGQTYIGFDGGNYNNYIVDAVLAESAILPVPSSLAGGAVLLAAMGLVLQIRARRTA